MGNFSSNERSRDSSFDYSVPPHLDVVWKSIKKVYSSAKYYENGLCVCDIKQQGLVGNCYYVSALYSIILFYTQSRPDLVGTLFHIISPWQSFDEPHYTGKFFFNLWNGFAWSRVQVDDLIPFSARNLPIASATQSQEFWPLLLEKAVLKFTNMSFESIDKGGLPSSIFNLLFPTKITTKLITNPSAKTIARYMNASSRTLCTVAVLDCVRALEDEKVYIVSRNREHVLANNLATYHAFTLFMHDPNVALVLNPWQISDYVGQIISMQHTANCDLCRATATVDNHDDGRWLMSVEDVAREFNALYVSQISGFSQKAAWYTQRHEDVNISSGREFAVFVHVTEFIDEKNLEKRTDVAIELEEDAGVFIVYKVQIKKSTTVYFNTARFSIIRHINLKADVKFISFCCVI